MSLAVRSLCRLAGSSRRLLLSHAPKATPRWRTASAFPQQQQRWATTVSNPTVDSPQNLQRANDLMTQGQHALEANQTQLAISKFLASVDVYPSSEGYHNLANVYYQLGRLDDALKYWQLSLDLAPSAETHTNMANVYFLVKRDTARAIEHYERALELTPADGEIWFNLGCVCDAAKELDKAINAFDRAEQCGIEKAQMLKRNVQAKRFGSQIRESTA
ncbi:hypothetical protein RI367_003968 [Sorochytrium milnesiophthora]